MSAACAQKGRKVAAVRLKTEMIQFCSETRSEGGSGDAQRTDLLCQCVWRTGRGRHSLNSTAIVGSAAATMVVSSACSVKGANSPKTIFHRYDRRRCCSAFSSGEMVLIVFSGTTAGAELLSRTVEIGAEAERFGTASPRASGWVNPPVTVEGCGAVLWSGRP